MTRQPSTPWWTDCRNANWDAVYRALLERLAEHDPVALGALNAPEEEPEDDEIEAIEEAMESIARGEPAIPHEELMRELGL